MCRYRRLNKYLFTYIINFTYYYKKYIKLYKFTLLKNSNSIWFLSKLSVTYFNITSHINTYLNFY